MRRRINRLQLKITSQSGASITYALLLFLVCATVGSVVLAAGTAAAGRMSQAVKNDQRYYSVTSAAEFLMKALDGTSTTIVYKDVYKDKEGTPPPPTNIISFNQDSSVPSTFDNVMHFASAVVAGASEVTLSDKASWKLEVAGQEALTVDVVPTILADTGSSNTDPTLILDVSNKDSEEKPSEKGKYTLRLTFKAGVEDIVSKKKKKTSSEQETILITKRKITWSFYSLETMSAFTSSETKDEP